MKIDASLQARLLFLIRVVQKLDAMAEHKGALNAGHLFVPTLIHTMNQFVAQVQRCLQAIRTS